MIEFSEQIFQDPLFIDQKTVVEAEQYHDQSSQVSWYNWCFDLENILINNSANKLCLTEFSGKHEFLYFSAMKIFTGNCI